MPRDRRHRGHGARVHRAAATIGARERAAHGRRPHRHARNPWAVARSALRALARRAKRAV